MQQYLRHHAVFLFEQSGEQMFVIDLLMTQTRGQRLSGANRVLGTFGQSIWVHIDVRVPSSKESST